MFKRLLIAAPLVATSCVLISLIIGKYTRKPKKREEESLLFAGILCDYHSNRCDNIACNKPRCVYNHMLRMKACIAEAKSTLLVCLYLITVDDLAMEIIRAQRRGVKVRFITDASMAMSNGSKFEMMRKSGIRCRLRLSELLMHHKFVIIDDKKLMMGSLNWTMQAIFGNWDNVVIFVCPTMIETYTEMFNKMWETIDAELTKKKQEVVL